MVLLLFTPNFAIDQIHGHLASVRSLEPCPSTTQFGRLNRSTYSIRRHNHFPATSATVMIDHVPLHDVASHRNLLLCRRPSPVGWAIAETRSCTWPSSVWSTTAQLGSIALATFTLASCTHFWMRSLLWLFSTATAAAIKPEAIDLRIDIDMD